MGFNTVSFGWLVEHGDYTNFLDVLFKEMEITSNSIKFIPHDYIYDNSKPAEEFSIEYANGDDNDVFHIPAVYEAIVNFHSFAVKYKDKLYPLAEGGACSYGLLLGVIHTGDLEHHYTTDDIRYFLDAIEWLCQQPSKVPRKPVLSILGNCCS